MRFSGESRLLIGLIVAFLFILAGSAASYVSSMSNIRTSRAVENSIQFTGALESLYVTVRDVDSNARSYVRSGKPAFLENYKKAQNFIPSQITEMKEVYHSDSRRSGYIEFLHQLINTLIREDEMGVRAKIDALPDAEKYLDLPGVTEMMRLVRSKIDSIEDDERGLLHSQIVDYDASTRSSINTYLVLSFLVLLFLLLLGGTTYRYIMVIRKAMEADQRVSHEIVEHAPIGILKLSSELKVTEVNPVFCAYTNKTADQIIDRKVTDILPELPKAAFTDAVEKGSAQQLDQLFVKLDKDDIESEKYWDVTVWPVREANAIKGMIVLIVDVTEKVNLSNQREVFAQTLTHDMKTPLIAADRIYEAILDSRVGSVDRAQFELMEKLRKNNQEVLKMVKDVLEVSRYKEHSLVLNQELLEINPVVHDVLNKLAAVSEHRRVRLDTTMPDALPPVWADKTAVHHLIFNLVENAIKFSPLDGTVSITAECNASTVIVHVKDSGPGMSEDEQKKLFKSSWQGELGKTAPSGTGLGLYLCHQIARANRGEIKCQSQLDHGTTFSVSLPVAPKRQPFIDDDDDDDEVAVNNVEPATQHSTNPTTQPSTEPTTKIAKESNSVEESADPTTVNDSTPRAVPS